MSAWSDTYAALGEELEAAKAAAMDAFMAAPSDSEIGAAAAVPPVQSRAQRIVTQPLTSDDVTKAKTVVWRAISQAVLKHIGPVSSDGSVTFGTVNTGDSPAVPQLDIKATLGSALNFYPGPMYKDAGLGSPGFTADHTVAKGTHYHPKEDPAVASTYLYPSLIPDTLLRSSCPSLVYYESPYTDLGGPGLDFSDWTQIAGVSTWQYNYNGPLFIGAPGGGSAVPMEDGDRFAVVNDLSASPNTFESPYLGIYELVHQADGVSNAIIRRTQDANTPEGLRNGVTVQVTDAAGVGDGGYYTFSATDPVSVDVSIISSSKSSSYTPDLTYELLTAAQLLTEGADNTSTLYAYAIGRASADFSPSPFITIVGTPGVSVLPAGPYGFQLEDVIILSSDADATATIAARLIDVDGGGATILTAYSTPMLGSSTPRTVSFQAMLAADYTFSPTRRLGLAYSMTSTAALDSMGMEISFNYSSPTRGTWVQLPISMAGGLTTVPAQNVTPGVLQTGMQTSTTVNSIIPPATNNSILITVDNSLTVNGMSTDGLISGTIFWLTFVNACKIVNGATVATGQAPFKLGSDYTAGINWNGVTPRTLGSITVQYFASGITGAPCFKLVGGPRV